MVEAGTLAVNADVKEEAGAFANATYTAEAYTNKYIKKAEGKLCLDTRYDWVTNYASVSTIGKEALRQAVSTLAAIKCINADTNSFASGQRALIAINVLWAQYSEVVAKIVKDNQYKEFILSGVGDID
jgi:hypothetical protein